MSHCTTCNAEIIWAKLSSGKNIPLEVDAGFAGTYRIQQGQDGTAYAVRVPAHSPSSPDRYRNHLGTCAKRPVKARRGL